MGVTPVVFFNTVLISLEFIAVIALWVWLFVKFKKLGKYFTTHTMVLTAVELEDPNLDLRHAITTLINRSTGMLPVVAALASLDVLFSAAIVSYFTLLPLVISLFTNYAVTTGNLNRFHFAAPRSEVVRQVTESEIIAGDTESRQKLLKSYVDRYRIQIVGHLNFLVAAMSFIAGTVVSRSFHLSNENLAFSMFHALLLSYIIAFLAEALLFRHRLDPTRPIH